MKRFNQFDTLKLICFTSIEKFISLLDKDLKILIVCDFAKIFEFVIKQGNIEVFEVIVE